MSALVYRLEIGTSGAEEFVTAEVIRALRHRFTDLRIFITDGTTHREVDWREAAAQAPCEPTRAPEEP